MQKIGCGVSICAPANTHVQAYYHKGAADIVYFSFCPRKAAQNCQVMFKSKETKCIENVTRNKGLFRSAHY